MWRKYGLSITLAALWLSNWVVYAVTLAYRPEGFDWQAFWEGTFENSTSEFLQLFTFVVLSSVLISRGSPQSKDGDERMEAKIDAIAADVAEMRSRRHV
jgi:hypothetical protein